MRYDPRVFVVVGLIGAIGGFLLIDNYVGIFSVVGNAVRGMVLGVLPYRYVLFCSLCLIGFGLYSLWITKGK